MVKPLPKLDFVELLASMWVHSTVLQHLSVASLYRCRATCKALRQHATERLDLLPCVIAAGGSGLREDEEATKVRCCTSSLRSRSALPHATQPSQSVLC